MKQNSDLSLERSPQRQTWTITPICTPAIVRHCSKCGNGSHFHCSDHFRINANGKSLDVWLIYKCKNCETTWNMEILSRVKPHQMDASLYDAFAKNDAALAMQYAFDTQIQNKNKAVACYEDIAYTIDIANESKPFRFLEITTHFDLNVRLDKVLSEQLHLSRSTIKSLFEKGSIVCNDPNVTFKTKVHGTIQLTLKENFHEIYHEIPKAQKTNTMCEQQK